VAAKGLLSQGVCAVFDEFGAPVKGFTNCPGPDASA
jgi:hypothetical protein